VREDMSTEKECECGDHRFAIPREQWGDGPWQNEPDKLQWKTKSGLPGLIVRNHAGAWCGYAGVDKTHPLYGVWYGEKAEVLDGVSPESKFEVHGGITYSDHCQGHICHVPEPGEPDDVFWYGFDCGHCNDFMPAHEAAMGTYLPVRLRFVASRMYTYRDVEFVKAEVEKLAAQLVEVK
jgi:hypothetical protein